MTDTNTAVLERMRSDLESQWSDLTEKLKAIDVLLGRNGSTPNTTSQSMSIVITTPETMSADEVGDAILGIPERQDAKRKPTKKRTSRKEQPAIDWDSVRREWEAGATVVSLARKYDCAESSIYRRKKAHAWHRAGETATPLKTAKPKTASKGGSRKKAIDWSKVRKDFEEKGLTQAALARKYGCSQQGILYRRKKENWQPRIKQARPAPKPTPAENAAPAPTRPGWCPKCRFEMTAGTCSNCGYRG